MYDRFYRFNYGFTHSFVRLTKIISNKLINIARDRYGMVYIPEIHILGRRNHRGVELCICTQYFLHFCS